MKKLVLSSLFLAGMALGTHAQFQSEYDALKVAQTDLNGSARFMSVAGAMGALGGDASTLFYNPAGIGTYRSSELTFTTNFNWNNSSALGNMGSRFLFNLNNVSYISSYLTGSNEGLVAFNWGFGYNRAKTFDKNVHYSTNSNLSLGDFLANYTELSGNASGFNASAFESNDVYKDQRVPWASVLAWDGWMIANPEDESNNPIDNEYESYRNYLTGQNIGVGGVENTYTIAERGSVNEYAFSAGANISNAVQLGVSFVLLNLDYKMTSIFKEKLDDNSSYTYSSMYSADGSGFSIKVGAIARPTHWLRIGGAFHSPSWYYIKDTNEGSVNGNAVTSSKSGNGSTPVGYGSYYLNTPMKGLANLGFVLGNYGFVGVDYEYTDYTTMKMKNNDIINSYMVDQNNKIATNFESTHTLRIGTELRPVENLAVRFGYAMATPAVKADAYRTYANNTTRTDFDFTNEKSTNYITAGLGYRFGKSYVDVAYVLQTKLQDYYAYNPTYVNGFGAPVELTSKHNQILLTYGVRF
jgi:hypothetical protein